ncbi:MAG TPA: phosphatase PAP2 family protein [Chitinophagaceae bacterium]|nr:phosphatase PAP2 family protein [Chitinophagaceae bacterium]
METQSTAKTKKPWYSILTIEFLFVILLLLALVVFIYLTRMVFIRESSEFDDRVFNTIKPYINDARTGFMLFITFLGKHDLLIPLNFVLIAFFIYRKERWFATRIAALSLSSLLLMFMLKFFFQRNRPLQPVIDDVSGYSFPSGHALISVVFYGLFIHMVWHEIKTTWLRTLLIIILGILILAIAFSRIYLRVHYASDVIAGIAVGFIWLVLSLRIIHRVEKRFIARRALKAEHLE